MVMMLEEEKKGAVVIGVTHVFLIIKMN